jgi:hypothetical protein
VIPAVVYSGSGAVLQRLCTAVAVRYYHFRSLCVLLCSAGVYCIVVQCRYTGLQVFIVFSRILLLFKTCPPDPRPLQPRYTCVRHATATVHVCLSRPQAKQGLPCADLHEAANDEQYYVQIACIEFRRNRAVNVECADRAPCKHVVTR